MELPTKYHAQRLFDYTGRDLDRLIERLVEQEALYSLSSQRVRLRMATRGLFAAALTLASTAVVSAKMLERGNFWMDTQIRFFRKRWRSDPSAWGPSAKSCLARSWSGFSLGPDSVCIDRHLERLGVQPENAVKQWRIWFDLYDRMYGPGETQLCIRWHEEVLEWIALRGPRPKAWK